MAPASSRHGTVASAAGLGLAGLVGGATFLSGTRQHSSHQQHTALRASATGQPGSRTEAPSAASHSFTAQAGIGAVAITSAAALLAQRGKICSKPSITSLKAFESELGVQAPVGFWDPLGLARDGDVVAFQRRRSVELKHGRISMLATMGYITPEVAGKFPGYLSPSAGLKFEDVPNGLAALSKVPAGGWTQILLYMGWCEVSRGAGSDIASGKPGDFGWYVLSSADPEEKTKKLNAEIANGRLAMMAIIGMFYQDGLTGSAWGDWANYSDSPLRAVDFSTELGVTPPFGFWDPLGLAAAGAGKTQDPEVIVSQFKRRRAVEIQHGRVAMFACIGYIVPEYFRWPGLLSKAENLAFADIPNGLKAYSYIPIIGWTQILAFVGTIEIYNLAGLSDDDRVPGDSPLFGAFGIPGGGSISDPERKAKSLNAELNNGRLAMFAIIGMFFQDGLTGSAWGDWSNYADSPMRAFESELGVQAPAGFWDPLGFAADGDAVQFRRRRYIELKHGRVAMFACLGYIVPEYYRWPGDLSPSLGLKFTDMPTGFAAFSKVPLSGWAQMIAFAGTVELFQYVDDPERAPGDFKNAGLLGVPNGFLRLSDEESRKKKLAAELANGRLAMMAIIGMFFQNGLTGTAWGDWAEYTASPLRAYENETGVQPPVGFWDPLGLSASGNQFDFNRRREVELKHGRVSMFATIGYILPEYWRFPGSLTERFATPIKFADMPNGLQAISKLPALGVFQIVLFAGLIETNVYNEQVNDEPGNYGAGFLGMRSVGIMNTGFQDPEVRKKKLNAELANGRLAMMAIIGMFFQDGLTGSAWGDWSNYADSPLRAFEGELGVQAPVGFWDPVGYTRDGNVETFKRRRETEIKHGRVAMYATIGYIVPEYFKWPGFLSPSLGLTFEDVPNGLAAISKVPGQGWSQIVAFAGYYEFFVYKYNGTPGDYGWKAITSSDPETLKKKLSAELANGRLAMMAIIGMFFQDGLTGSAWGDWALYTDSPLRSTA